MHLKNKKGMTLLEIMIVLVIVGLMAAIAVPSFLKIRPNMRLRSAAMDLHANMQKMRIQAIRTNNTTAVIFDIANNSYSTCHDYNTVTTTCVGVSQNFDFDDLGSGVTFGKGHSTTAVDGGSFPATFANFPSLANTATFDRTGLGNNGEVYLENEFQESTFSVTQTVNGLLKTFQWTKGSWN